MVSSDESSSSDYYDDQESSSGSSSSSSSSETTQNLEPMSSEVSLELVEVRSGDGDPEFDMMTIVPKNIIFDASTGFVLGYRYRTILKP